MEHSESNSVASPSNENGGEQTSSEDFVLKPEKPVKTSGGEHQPNETSETPSTEITIDDLNNTKNKLERILQEGSKSPDPEAIEILIQLCQVITEGLRQEKGGDINREERDARNVKDYLTAYASALKEIQTTNIEELKKNVKQKFVNFYFPLIFSEQSQMQDRTNADSTDKRLLSLTQTTFEGIPEMLKGLLAEKGFQLIEPKSSRFLTEVGDSYDDTKHSLSYEGSAGRMDTTQRYFITSRRGRDMTISEVYRPGIVCQEEVLMKAQVGIYQYVDPSIR